MYKVIFELITEPLGLPIEWYYEWFILWAINEIAYQVAYDKVGILYHGTISGRSAGSFFHWLIRTIVFVVIWAVTYGVIQIGRFIMAYKQYVTIGVGVIAVVVIGFKLWIWYRNQSRLARCSVRVENDEN